MKRTLLTVIAAVTSIICMTGQTPADVEYVFTEASDLNIIGKIHENTPNPYHRVDTVRYKGFNHHENIQVRCSAGLAVLFRTNSTTIAVQTEFGHMSFSNNTMGIALRGYDLYIKDNGLWKYAASKATDRKSSNLVLISNMDTTEKECMLYLPMYSEEYSVKIGVEKGAELAALESPFRHRVGIFGSSFTQGISISRSGMSYPMQFMRNTGIQILSLGCSGNCKLQPYFAEVLADADVDALLFDTFSNPTIQMIEERLFPFIERIQKSHPDIPLIFMQTIYRENRNFDKKSDKLECERQKTADRMMAEAVKKYKNVYFIQTNATDRKHETSVDGVHPSDMGYKLWAESIEKPILKILRKYGIK